MFRPQVPAPVVVQQPSNAPMEEQKNEPEVGLFGQATPSSLRTKKKAATGKD